MKPQLSKTCEISLCCLGGVFFSLLFSNAAISEIIPDTTLPENSIVTTEGNTRVIEGGTLRDGNLFHSFQEFSFSASTIDTTGDTAFFRNDAVVRNIITRVTGGLPSNIDGTIKANGSANVFFINPAGIIFGPNASLSIGGSFIASTANSLKFKDGTEFSANISGTTPLLTISVPIGLQFGANPGEIINQSQASLDGAVNTLGVPTGLQVPSSKTLALVGGTISLSDGNLTALNGRIELGSVDSNSYVSLNEVNTHYVLEYSGVQTFRDIQISGVTSGSLIDISGDGGIQVQGKNITLTDNSLIFSIATGSQASGNLIINASESVKLNGGSNIGTFAEGEGKAGDVFVKAFESVELEGTASGAPTFLGSQVCVLSAECGSVTGNGGNLTIDTKRLLVRDGASVDTSTFGVGNAGNILIKASSSVDVRGTSLDGSTISAISTQVAQNNSTDNPGNAGSLNIETQQLIVQDGAQILTVARKSGDGGNLTINATNSILLSGALQFATASLLDNNRSGLFVSAEEGATGSVGSLNLTTGVLTVENGARISADNLGSGLPGSSTLNVRQLRIQNGGEIKSGSFFDGDAGTLTVNATESVSIVGTGIIGNETIPSTLFSQSLASGRAGNLTINTPILSLSDRAELTVGAKGTGPAGNLTVNARSILLDNNSIITADTRSNDADPNQEQATINLRARDLILLRRNSKITSSASGTATGGNINIDTNNLVAVPRENSDIRANAQESFGGRVRIKTSGIFGIQFRQQDTPFSDITVSSAQGPEFSGSVEINTPDVDPNRGLVQLPTVVLNTPNLVASRCAAFDLEGSSFTISGRGGLPPSPDDPLSNDVVWTDTRLPATTAQQTREKPFAKPFSKPESEPIAIIPATAWVFNGKGEVTLISKTSSTNNLESTPSTCTRNFY